MYEWCEVAAGFAMVATFLATGRDVPPLALRLVVINDGRQQWNLVSSVLEKSKLNDRDIIDISWALGSRNVLFAIPRKPSGAATSAVNAETEAHWMLLANWGGVILNNYQSTPNFSESPHELFLVAVLHAYFRTIKATKENPRAGSHAYKYHYRHLCEVSPEWHALLTFSTR